VARDFEGRQDRDVVSATLQARREGSGVSLTSTTGFVRWKTVDVTDLDYLPYPFLTRDNAEEAKQFSQELRIASAAASPLRMSSGATLAWQAGVFAFTQRYEQDAVNSYGPFVLSEFLPFPVDEHNPEGTIKDLGLAAFGHATATFSGRADLSVGARADRERKTADLRTFFEPAIAQGGLVDARRTWTTVSPSASFAYRLDGGRLLYVSTGRGFKAGGFNPAAPASASTYDEEHNWNTEAGVKATWANGRVRTNASVFYLDWTDLQLNLPNPAAPGLFYIANVGDATSRGVEIELTARAADGVDVFGAFGHTRARFSSGSVSSGVDVSDNLVPFTPDYTASLGLDVNRAVRDNIRAFGHAELVRQGSFQYDDANTAGQSAYTLVNLRAGIGVGRISIEGFLRNAFDTCYIPTAFAYPGLTASGFLGESGRPRTFGISLSAGF